jgi:hypothetical protein
MFMSNNLLQGNPYGLALERQARNKENAAWASECDALRKRLEIAEVEREVSVAYVTALRHALRDIMPNHQLLNERVAVDLFERTRAAAYSKRRSGDENLEQPRRMRP